MFRKMRRFKQQLSVERCKQILSESKRAVFSVIGDDGYPYGIPINYIYDESENAIFIHGAKEGHKIDAIKNCEKVSFTTWQEIEKNEYGFDVESVIIFGKALLVDSMKLVEKQLWDIGKKYHDDNEYIKNEVVNNLNVVQIIKIEIQYITGKRVNEA